MDSERGRLPQRDRESGSSGGEVQTGQHRRSTRGDRPIYGGSDSRLAHDVKTGSQRYSAQGSSRRYHAQGGRQRSAYGRQANQQRYASAGNSFHYRQAQQAAADRRWRFAVIGVGLAIVILALVTGGIAIMNRGSVATSQDSSDMLAQSALSDTKGSFNSAGEGPAASTSDGQPDTRSADFAVDPNRTDWNFSTNGKKTVYLTIDDGPSEKTQQVLDILDRYNCKATFFVVGHNEAYFPLIAEAYKRGHTIGLHSMTHDYAQIYSSAAAYLEDIEALGQVVKDQIGFVPCFIRFPGGSSNSISSNYCKGVMTELTASVQEKGYQYYDWNLSVGDGSEHTADEIAEFGMADEGNENIMLLCHDSATKQPTVDALPRIIEHYQALGYSFEAIDRGSWVCHHGVTN